MVQYRFAHDSRHCIVDAVDLAKIETPRGDEFFCLVCERRLIAKVHGSKKQPHFAHHPGADCHPETYLHRLAKQVFYEVYRKCLDESLPFFIELTCPRYCRNYADIFGMGCDLQRPERVSYDLLTYYNEVKLECPQDGFVPDLLLFRRDDPEKRVFVEIAVTHLCESPKLLSSNRIIEIPIANESDVNKIRRMRLTENDACFVNFSRPSLPVTDAECQCHFVEGHAFIQFESGKCFLINKPMCEIRKHISERGDKVRYVRLFDSVGASMHGFRPTEGAIFRRGIEDARASGLEIKNCYICRHRRPSDTTSSESQIYCDHLKATFKNSNEAVQCPDFQYDPTATGRAEKTGRRQRWRF